MPKLYSARQVIKSLQRLGFVTVSQKGSHIKMRNTKDGKVFSPIIPNHKELAIGTLGSVLRQAGITKEEFDENI